MLKSLKKKKAKKDKKEKDKEPNKEKAKKGESKASTPPPVSSKVVTPPPDTAKNVSPPPVPSKAVPSESAKNASPAPTTGKNLSPPPVPLQPSLQANKSAMQDPTAMKSTMSAPKSVFANKSIAVPTSNKSLMQPFNFGFNKPSLSLRNMRRKQSTNAGSTKKTPTTPALTTPPITGNVQDEFITMPRTIELTKNANFEKRRDEKTIDLGLTLNDHCMVMEIETTPALSPLYNHMKKYDTIIQIGSKGDLRKVSTKAEILAFLEKVKTAKTARVVFNENSKKKEKFEIDVAALTIVLARPVRTEKMSEMRQEFHEIKQKDQDDLYLTVHLMRWKNGDADFSVHQSKTGRFVVTDVPEGPAMGVLQVGDFILDVCGEKPKSSKEVKDHAKQKLDERRYISMGIIRPISEKSIREVRDLIVKRQSMKATPKPSDKSKKRPQEIAEGSGKDKKLAKEIIEGSGKDKKEEDKDKATPKEKEGSNKDKKAEGTKELKDAKPAKKEDDKGKDGNGEVKDKSQKKGEESKDKPTPETTLETVKEATPIDPNNNNLSPNEEIKIFPEVHVEMKLDVIQIMRIEANNHRLGLRDFPFVQTNTKHNNKFCNTNVRRQVRNATERIGLSLKQKKKKGKASILVGRNKEFNIGTDVKDMEELYSVPTKEEMKTGKMQKFKGFLFDRFTN